jgi:hypothetical protein
MSALRDAFEQEVRNSETQTYDNDRWETAIDNLNGMSIYEMLRVLYALRPIKRQEVLDAAKYILTVKRQWKDPFDRIAWAAQVASEVRVVPPRFGLFTTKPGFSDPDEVVAAKVFVAENTAGGGGAKGDFIMLTQPSMAFNDSGLGISYKMRVTRSVASGAAFSGLLVDAAGQGALKHLIFNCHGEVAAGGATTLLIGSGLDSSHNAEFAKLQNKVGVIWLCGCMASNSVSGVADCRERASSAKSYLVAPAFLMSSGSHALPDGQMDMNVRFLPHVFTPTGGDLTWGGFLAMGATLGFTTHFKP